jgi:hypothetical protein
LVHQRSHAVISLCTSLNFFFVFLKTCDEGSWRDLELTEYEYSNGLVSETVRRKAEQGQAMKSVQSETMKAFEMVIIVVSGVGSSKVWSVSPRFIESCSFLYLKFSLGLDISVNIANLALGWTAW